MMGDGTIKVDKCNSHVRVEWKIDVNLLTRWEKSVSDMFEIGNQSYALQLSTDSCLSLCRMGPPVQRSIRWWAGLKLLDGRYHYMQGCGDLNLGEEYLSLRKFQDLVQLHKSYLNHFRGYPSSFGIAAYFQVKVEQEFAGTEPCTHDSAEAMFPPSEGEIHEKECSCRKHVEWTFDFDWRRNRCYVSSIFDTENQRFRFVCCGGSSGVRFQLFRLGASVDDPGISWCWAGLKRGDGTYHHENKKYELIVKKECEVWIQVEKLSHVKIIDIFKYHLSQNNRLTFFLRMTEGTEEESCAFGRAEEFPRGVGSIQQEMLSPYMLVKWTFRIDNDELWSPGFVVGNQNYLLTLVYTYRITVFVTRMGPSANRYVPILATMRRSDDMFEDFGCHCGELDLRTTLELWVGARFMCRFRQPAGARGKEFTLDFLLTCDESPAAGMPCMSTLPLADVDTIKWPETDPPFVAFKVGNMAFKMRKALILVCVPMFKRWLTTECSESETGVITIKDCEPVVFEEFLKLLESGFTKEPSAENALALYDEGKKYLLRELPYRCSLRIRDELSVENFCDVLDRCFLHNDENLLRFAGDFLSRHREITESASFSEISSKYRDETNKLMQAVFPTN